jgi:Ca2+-binding EF-hand superfamily protein
MLIKSNFPYKNKKEVNDLLDAKMEGYLSEDEVQEIVKYMYSQEDAGVILNTVMGHLSRGAHLGNDRRLTREERQQVMKEQEKRRIKFSTFQKIILDFQLKSHENFLYKFIEKFKLVDKDQNGIIDEQELRQLIKYIDPRHEMGIKPEDMLDLLDPFSNNKITFSSVVTLLSSQLTNFNGKQLSVLHRISLE